jgi:hypothetical protein
LILQVVFTGPGPLLPSPVVYGERWRRPTKDGLLCCFLTYMLASSHDASTLERLEENHHPCAYLSSGRLVLDNKDGRAATRLHDALMHW